MNKTTKHYFINLFKRKKKLLALYTFVCFMGYPFLLIADKITNDGNGLMNNTSTAYILALVVLGILSVVLPIFTFKFSFTKKNVDTYFAMPMNRNHMFKSHYFGPILGTIIPILINFLIGGILFMIFTGEVNTFFKLFACLLLAFVMFIVIYTINTFIVLKCNNVLDASLVSIAYVIIPFLFNLALSSFLYSQIVRTGMVEVDYITDHLLNIMSPYVGLINLGETINSSCAFMYGCTQSIDFSIIDWGYMVYYVVLGFIFYRFAKITFKAKKGESAEQLTTSYITYPLLINVGFVSFILLFNLVTMDFVAATLIVVALFVVYTIANGIANRSITINPKMIIKFVALIVAVNLFNYVSQQTEFFGINRNVIDHTKYESVNVEFYMWVDYKEDGIESTTYHIQIDEMNDKEEEFFDLLKEYQKNKSIELKENKNIYEENYVAGNLSIAYQYKSNHTEKMAYFDLTNKEAEQFLKLYHEMKESK